PAGEHGFGYDPHFYLPQQGCTAAQLAPEHKNRISHRAQALAQLLDKLRATGPVGRP
ncbi:Ham1-like family protein, partial [Bordetella bronchiseptica D993]